MRRALAVLAIAGMAVAPVTAGAPALAAMQANRPHAMIIGPDPLFFQQRAQLLDFARTTKLPVVYPYRDFVEAGGLMSYSLQAAEVARTLARYVDRILQGVRPADLPVEEPARLELAINLKAAKALGLTIPRAVLLRADHVIQ